MKNISRKEFLADDADLVKCFSQIPQIKKEESLADYADKKKLILRNQRYLRETSYNRNNLRKKRPLPKRLYSVGVIPKNVNPLQGILIRIIVFYKTITSTRYFKY